MDPLTQGTLGAALSQGAADSARNRAFAVAGGLAALVPDLDILIRSNTDPSVYLEYHRQFSHSLLFIPLGAGLCALLMLPLLKRWLQPRQIGYACLLGYATHGLLDACTSFGTQLFWPFSDVRIAWNWISVVDPLFSVPLLALVLMSAYRRKRVFAAAAICWALGYLALGALLHHTATNTAQDLAAKRGHVPVRLTVKPGFANLIVWKSAYEAQGRIYVDGIRIIGANRVCEGESIARFELGRDLPWLDPTSQQARDLERLNWYSDGWLALDQEDPHYVVDVRYASLPNRIDALWGFKVDPQAAADTHADWHVVSSRRSEDLTKLTALLKGTGCRPLSP